MIALRIPTASFECRGLYMAWVYWCASIFNTGLGVDCLYERSVENYIDPRALPGGKTAAYLDEHNI